MDIRVPDTRQSSTAFPRVLVGTWIGSRVPSLQVACLGSLSHYNTMQAPAKDSLQLNLTQE